MEEQRRTAKSLGAVHTHTHCILLNGKRENSVNKIISIVLIMCLILGYMAPFSTAKNSEKAEEEITESTANGRKYDK